MRQSKWMIGASWVSLNLRCDYDIQWEAFKQSRDLDATVIETQSARRESSNQNEIEHWPVHNQCYTVEN